MLREFLQGKEHPHRVETAAKRSEAEEQLSKTILGKDVNELLDMFGLLNRQVNGGAILLMVLRLRQCCNHLSLLREVLACPVTMSCYYVLLLCPVTMSYSFGLLLCPVIMSCYSPT